MKLKLPNPLNNFVTFVREQGVMGLAIGFILGDSTKQLVTSFVEDIVRPVIGLVIGDSNALGEWTVYGLALGNFLATIIDFLIIAAVIFFVFKGLKLDKLDKKKEA